MRSLLLLIVYASLAISKRLAVLSSGQAPASPLSACKAAFKGQYSNDLVYLLDEACGFADAHTSKDFDLEESDSILLVQQAEVKDKSNQQAWKASVLSAGSRTAAVNRAQVVFHQQHVLPRLMFSTDSSLFYVVNDAEEYPWDRLFPADTKIYQLPSYDLPEITALKEDDRLLRHLPVQFDHDISTIIKSISVDTLESIVRYLSGEDEKSQIRTRHTFTDGCREAARWLKGEFEQAGFSCELHHYKESWSPNVVCLMPRHRSSGNVSDEIVLISGHYDSRGTFGSVRAGGGDDDASGTAAVLSIAKAIQANRIAFDREVMLVAFSGEEQGLVGSRHLAKELKDRGRDVLFMLQNDMLAYRVASEPMQMGIPPIGSKAGIWLLGNVTNTYVPQLRVGETLACCSDHQSFHELGFSAVQAFERNGPIADPFYHDSRDLSDRQGYDFEQLKASTQAVFATLLEVAGFRRM